MRADAVILATGGFQADREMKNRHFGPGGQSLRLLAPRAHHNTGDGIRVAMEHGARISGDWNGMHAEPVDPRAENAAAVVLVYPYGIVVDQNGRRFFDEGGGLVHETWEWFARKIHFETRRDVMGWRQAAPFVRRSPTGRAPSSSRRFWPIL